MSAYEFKPISQPWDRDPQINKPIYQVPSHAYPAVTSPLYSEPVRMLPYMTPRYSDTITEESPILRELHNSFIHNLIDESKIKKLTEQVTDHSIKYYNAYIDSLNNLINYNLHGLTPTQYGVGLAKLIKDYNLQTSKLNRLADHISF